MKFLNYVIHLRAIKRHTKTGIVKEIKVLNKLSVTA
jgi:hypothetical protein